MIATVLAAIVVTHDLVCEYSDYDDGLNARQNSHRYCHGPRLTTP